MPKWSISSHEMRCGPKIFFVLRIDSRESVHSNRPDSHCESPGHLKRKRHENGEKWMVATKVVTPCLLTPCINVPKESSWGCPSACKTKVEILLTELPCEDQFTAP